ncbi:hypothetical protein AB0F77_16605 [Streptomyces sp. NPDC026672]|uniref:hypothetical protein n=1 Tax=unclassified Streptomyces TaxID=2593676 RepID=UPI0033E17052
MFGLPWLMSFFHQDAHHTGSTPAAIVTYHFVEELDPEEVLLVRRDAQQLADGLDADENAAVWKSCADSGPTFYQVAGAEDASAWMRQVVDLCDAWLSRRTPPRHLPPADQYDGPELAGQVTALLREVRHHLAPKMADTLEKTVGSCTPDLAFRLLVHALPNARQVSHRAAITAEQYTSFVELAAAFDYGEYALSDLDAVFDG